MNKFSLTFIQKCLEQKYQGHRYLSTIPACKVINLMCFTICMIRSIFCVIVQDYINVFIFAPLGLLVFIVHFVVMFYKKQWIDFYLVGINHLLMCYQVYTEADFKPQEAFVFGQNMMVMHTIIILVSDFKFAVIQVINNAIIKLAIAKYFQPDISIQAFIYCFILTLMIVIPLQRTNKQYRESFLYTTQNNSLDWIIPKIIENPFAIFVYDKENVGFQVKLSNFNSFNQFESTNSNLQNLNFILRNYKLNGKTLETFVLNRRKNSDNITVNQEHEIINSKNYSDRIYIKYSEVQLTEQTFIIILDQKQQSYIKMEHKIQRLETGINLFLNQLKAFLIKQLLMLNKSTAQDLSYIYQNKVNLMYILTKLSVQPNLFVHQCKVVPKIQNFIKLFNKAYNKRVHFQFDKQHLQILTYKNVFEELLTILMTFIFRTQESSQAKLILRGSYYQNEQFLDLLIKYDQSYQLFQQLQQNIHFRSNLKQIGPYDRVLMENNGIC
ncbi:unnamed protein product (macronuclear) [Paramecium tetraurelia]|uniref:Transmembrane protein n=1 Tax=Paramecium tetraurelia TaxID=5888 RepID=A0BRL3_PARTE|nr:uncharacterized protein GSPATT00031411001 [Paramecium tetraurelia]CAK61180.1 unnamed protein product [Paramecium tetraurelia]|eukprot:XP_001428578.1 hypothetical protein (macronuclear) [Paramecium tetraurelia strain d4-2]